MVGRQTWRKSGTFLVGVAACSALLFALGATRPQAAGDLFERLRDGVRNGIRTLTGRSETRATRRPAVIRAESARAYALEMDRLARDRNLLRLPASDVDPLSDGGVPVDTRLPAAFYAPVTSFVAPPEMEDAESGAFVPGSVEYWILQYGATSSKRMQDELAQLAGAEIVGFWPNAAYLVRLDSGAVGSARNLSAVRWSGRYHPSYKVDARLREQLAAGDDPSRSIVDDRGMMRLQVNFHRGIHGEAYRDALASVPGLELLSLRNDSGTDAVAMVELAPFALADALVQLANLRDVRSVELNEVPWTSNDHSVWFLQTGIADIGLNNFDVTARLFALGINGRGLGGYVADDGLENDLCYFRYTANLEDVTFQTLDDNMIYPEGGDLAADRTRLRKVSAYIVYDNATAYSSDIQHGTGTAGCMLGDNYGHSSTGGSLAARPFIRDIGRLQNLTSCEDPSLDWSPGETLRVGDPDMVVDDPTVVDPTIVNDFGTRVQHHDARDGMAPGAHLVMADIGNATGLGGLLGGFQAVRDAWGYGATSMNMSFGGDECDNCYTGAAPFVDQGAWLHRMVVPFSSAGNDGSLGTSTIGSGFAQGKNVVTVGATERANGNSANGVPRTGENIASYSGRGPKSGGLLAPEIVAPGTVVTAANNSLAVNPEDGSGSGDGGCIAQGGFVNGTSFSGPTAAGLGLLVQQYYLDGWYPSGVAEPINAMRPTNSLVRATLINSARNLGGARTGDDPASSGDRPNFGQGWGAPRLDDTLFFEGDPLRGVDPFGDTQRARMLVLTDTPNGLTDTGLLLPEPGGSLRSEIVQNFRSAIAPETIHEFPLNVIKNPSDPMDPADELRISMCYADINGSSPTGRTTVNDLDLEAISPSGVVYRSNPLTAWTGGYTDPAQDQTPQEFVQFVGFTDFPNRDPNNTCENIFVSPETVEQGTWNIRVIGYDVPGNGAVRNDATPNFVNDQAPSVDTDVPCDGVPDVDTTDQIFSNRQGYALLVSGNFTTTQGTIALNRTSFLCEGGELNIQVTDENGDEDGEPPCGARTEITVDLVTTVPNAGFTADREIVTLFGTQPIYANAEPLPVEVISDPSLVVHGDGAVQIVEGESIIVRFVDNNPCGGRATAQANVACRPSVSNQGFVIDEGCDRADASDPNSDVRPDGFMDSGELNVYTARFANNGGEDLSDVVVSLRPDPADPLMTAILEDDAGVPIGTGADLIDVLNSPQPVGFAPPGRISDARFLVQMGDACTSQCDPLTGTVDGIPPQYSMDFIVCVTSPEDGLLYPDCFTQTQSLEADIESFRYDTRDPAGELYGLGRIERQIAGPDGSMDPNDYVTNSPMWFDPGLPFPGGGTCAENCNIPRSMWDAANLAVPGTGSVPPANCFLACRPGGAGEDTFNPYDPWDFEDDDEGFVPAAYDGDPQQVGPPGATGGQEWFWKNAAMGGGGCGWEDEIIGQLDGLGPGTHPDVPTDPWGIWHTGAINASTAGPYPDASPPNTGVPHNPEEADPNFRTILWLPDGATNTNESGEWCDSYISNTALGEFYRSFLIPPSLFKVHANDPEFRVEFREWRTYTRMDGHTIDGDNLAIAGWYFSNEPVDPISFGPRTHSWAQYEYGQLIFSDDVRDDWADDDTFVSENLRTLDPSFTDFTFEDFFGPASPSWDMALTWAHLHFGGFASGGEYGWGIDDFSFVWTESRDIADRGDCGDAMNPVQPPLVFFGESRYNACAGDLDIVVRDPVRTEPEIAVCVTSAVEDFEVAYLRPTGVPGEYRGTLPYNADPRFEADGVLSILAGQVDVGRGADTAVVEYDPGNRRDWDPNWDNSAVDPDDVFTVEGACDWQDTSPEDGRNDDSDGDGTPDAEDGAETGRDREVRDAAAMNCTSGLIFVIKHELQDFDAVGDGDRFADRGETVWMSFQLASQLGATLEDVEVTISTEDDTVCILQDTVRLDELEGGNVLTDTPIDPFAEPGRQGFLFAVPPAVQTTNLEEPRTVTFRIDVKGLRQDNLNEFTTFGDGFNSFLPLETTLFLDLDETTTPADYVDPVTNPPRDPGQFLEGFEGPPGFFGYDHPREAGRPGWALSPLIIDATQDSRYGANLNDGFCPECTDCEVGPTADCEYAFDGGAQNFSQWQFTSNWAYNGLQAMKFGEPGAGPMRQDQSYEEGQYTAIESPPLFLSNDPGITPELSFRHIADFWQVSFTGGLDTVLGSGVLELSANPAGLPLVIQRARESEIRRVHPQDSFVRVYPYQQGYDSVTDALNACRTLYCGYHHPVFGNQGDPLNASTDDRAGTRGGTWEEVRVDLSDWKGMQVVVRWTVAVLQDLDIQSGRIGWLLDDISFEGVSTRSAFSLETGSPAVDPCGIIAMVETTSADCEGEETYVFDRHSGLGMFDPGTGSPFPIEYEWSIGSATIRGFGDEVISGEPGFRGRYENPILDLANIAGIAGAGTYPLSLTMYQDGVEVGSTTSPIVYKDAPVPAFTPPAELFAGAQARFRGSATVQPSPDPARDLVYIWDFGDGSAISTAGPVPNHVFQAEGTYDVTLCVRDEDNCESCVTETVNVIAAPDFGAPVTNFVTDCADPATPAGIVGDGNPDFNEYVTFELSFTNGGAPATDVVGYLSSSDRDVEIVQDTAAFGDVAAGAPSAAQPFTFILRDDGSVPTCLVVPFRLTLVSNGGTVVQDVNFSYTMGQGVDVADASPVAPVPCSFPFGDDTGGCEMVKPGVPGCLDGIRVRVSVTGTNLATVGEMNVTLFTPSGRAIGLHFGDGADADRTFELEAYFGVDGDAPIPDTGGELVEIPAGVLPRVTRETFVDSLTGEPLDFVGGGEWRLVVAPRNPIGAVPGSPYTVNEAVIELEGKESTDLEVAVEQLDCSTCVAATTPIYDGLTAACVPGRSGVGALTWPPAVDPSTCAASDDLQYEIYVSGTAGQLGDLIDPVDYLDRATQTCEVDCPTGGCAFERAPGASTWRVCGLQDFFWTVVVSDGGDPATRVPNVSAPTDPVPAGYQSESVNCVAAPMGPIFGLTKSPTGTVEAWVEDPMGDTGRAILPALMPGTGTGYTMFRGSLASIWSVAGGDEAGYDHETISCSVTGPSVDLGSQPGRPGEPGWYYLMPAAGTGGCGGLGYRGTPGPGSGLQFVEGRPNGPNAASCPPAEADCLP